MFNRLLHPSLTRSFFLFGPRSTGKSTLLKTLLPESEALWIDLLNPDLERELSQSPSKLIAILDHEFQHGKRKWVVIDEVQKVPELLSVVHQFIQ
jgi:predicted AAA+ superfamily ATPase